MEHHRGDADAVLNGIAALPAPGEFLLTGKHWRSVYHVRLAEGLAAAPETAADRLSGPAALSAPPARSAQQLQPGPVSAGGAPPGACGDDKSTWRC